MLQTYLELKQIVLNRPFRITRGERVIQENAFLKMIADDLSGWGEAARSSYGPDASRQLREEMAPLQRVVERIDPGLNGSLEDVIRQGVGDLPPASGLRCVVESALCDLYGQKHGQPVWQQLGLRPGPIPISSFTLGIDSPEIMREKLAEVEGLPILKIKLGSEHDEEVLALIRQSTDAVLRVDANGGWTPENAAEKVRMCADRGVEFIEQPLPMGMIDEAAALAETSPLPIVLDEDCRTVEDVRRLAGRVHGVNVKLRKSGGVWSACQVIQEAKACGLQVMIGCFIESSVGITAAAHLGSLADWIDLDGHVLINNDPFHGIEWDAGRITLPDRPGLGIVQI